jgi:nucleotide-binding universal stress UspA family protein
MPKKILIPLDGSKLGESALTAVDQFLTQDPKNDPEVILLGVVTSLSHWVVEGEGGVEGEVAGPTPYTETELEIIKNKTREYLERVAKALKSRGVKVSTEVRTGHADQEILKAIEALKVDMVAMSTHGYSGIKHLVFGSVTEKILRQSPVPVLTVRAQE